jgi:hypothetical protein
MEEYEGFVYLWLNQRNGMKYVGSHKGREDDGYIGSGVNFLKAYTPECFERIILEYCKNSSNIKEIEEKWLSFFDAAHNPNFYNRTNSAYGGNNHGHLPEDRRKEIYRGMNNAFIEKTRNLSFEERENLKRKKQSTWERNSKVRTRHAQNTSERRKTEELKKTEKEKSEFAKECRFLYWNRDVSDIQKHHQNQSFGVLNWHKTKSPELEKQRRQNVSSTRKKLSLKYINKDGVLRQVPEEQLQIFIGQGWSKGMGARKKSSS